VRLRPAEPDDARVGDSGRGSGVRGTPIRDSRQRGDRAHAWIGPCTAHVAASKPTDGSGLPPFDGKPLRCSARGVLVGPV